MGWGRGATELYLGEIHVVNRDTEFRLIRAVDKEQALSKLKWYAKEHKIGGAKFPVSSMVVNRIID